MKTTAALLALLATTTVANAVTVTGSAIGNWSDFEATQGYGVLNNDDGNGQTSYSMLAWGYTDNCSACTSFNNLWAFNGVGSDGDSPWNTGLNSPFRIGDLYYRNGSVYGSDFSGASLNVDLSITAPVTVTRTFGFDLEVINVPNTTGNAITDGDIARIVGSVSNEYFTVGNVDYTLELVGFSQDGGQTMSAEFNSPEASINNVGLYAQITAVQSNPVPLPGAASMLIGGVLAFGYVKRRRKQS